MLYVTLGITGSGKSHWIRNFCESVGDILVISPDKIREELTGNVSDQTRNGEVFKIAYKRLQIYFEDGMDVIFDATSLRKKDRLQLLEKAHQGGVPVTLVVLNDSKNIELCRKRVETDIANGKIRADTRAPHISENQHKLFMESLISIETEGWDYILYID